MSDSNENKESLVNSSSDLVNQDDHQSDRQPNHQPDQQSDFSSNKIVENQEKESIASIINKEFVGILVPHEGKFKYYCDQNRQWAMYTDDYGAKLMNLLIDRVKSLMEMCCHNIFKAANKDESDLEFLKSEIIRGKAIYGEKQSYKSAKKKGSHEGGAATWSEEEYKDPAFHFEYLKLKSLQRFTENYNLLERAYNEGIFNEYIQCDEPVKLCIASLGGGPGYELFAFKCFADKHLSKNVSLRLISMDLEDSWEKSAVAMGNEFVKWDLREQMEVESFIGEPVNFIMLSYVVYHYMNDEKTSKQIADLISRENIKAVLINERSKDLKSVNYMEKLNIPVCHILNHKFGKDNRQVAYLNKTYTLKQPERKLEITFPNVPYMDNYFKKNQQYNKNNRNRNFINTNQRNSNQDGGNINYKKRIYSHVNPQYERRNHNPNSRNISNYQNNQDYTRDYTRDNKPTKIRKIGDTPSNEELYPAYHPPNYHNYEQYPQFPPQQSYGYQQNNQYQQNYNSYNTYHPYNSRNQSSTQTNPSNNPHQNIHPHQRDPN